VLQKQHNNEKEDKQEGNKAKEVAPLQAVTFSADGMPTANNLSTD
jgi:hypothetical protein